MALNQNQRQEADTASKKKVTFVCEFSAGVV